MKRTSFVTGVIFPALAAALAAACDDGGGATCEAPATQCDDGCVDLTTDEQNCGMCGMPCSGDMTCTNSMCVSNSDCTPACGAGEECIAAECIGSLAVMQTSKDDGTTGRDLFVLQDVTLDLTQINSASFATSRVVDHKVLPDGSLLLVAAEETEGNFELYHSPAGGGALVKLSATGGHVLPGIVVSRDGSKVLYRADPDPDEVYDLFVVAVAGPGTPVQVNDALVSGGNVSRVFAISDDGTRAAYIADQETVGLDEAYTVDLSGATPGASQKLNPLTTTSIWDLVMTGDGSKVVYRAEDPSFGAPNLFVVSTAAPGTADWVQNTDGGEGHVESYRLTRDGSAVIYSGSKFFLEEQLWRAPLTPPYDSVVLVPSAPNEWVRPDFVVTADGETVYFRKVDTFYDRIFKVSVDMPGVTTPLIPVADGPEDEATDFILSADEKSLVFRGGADGAEGGNLTPGTEEPFPGERYAPAIYHLDLTVAPATPTLLSPAISSGGEGIGEGYLVTDDGQRTLYRADQEAIGASDVWLTSLATPGTQVKVSPPLNASTDSTDVSILSGF